MKHLAIPSDATKAYDALIGPAIAEMAREANEYTRRRVTGEHGMHAVVHTLRTNTITVTITIQSAWTKDVLETKA